MGEELELIRFSNLELDFIKVAISNYWGIYNENHKDNKCYLSISQGVIKKINNVQK